MTVSRPPRAARAGPLRLLPGVLARPLLRAVLATLALGLRLTRRRARVRDQITRTLSFTLATEDGVARTWWFDGVRRTVRSAPGTIPDPDHGAYFESSARALAGLVSPRAVAIIVGDVHRGRVRIRGSMLILLWFWGLTRTFLPLGRTPGPGPLPGAYLAHDPATHGAESIVVEPARDELDHDWHAAWAARSRLWLVRGGAGEPMPEP